MSGAGQLVTRGASGRERGSCPMCTLPGCACQLAHRAHAGSNPHFQCPAHAGGPTRPHPGTSAACCASCAWRRRWCCWAPSSSTCASSASLPKASTARVRCKKRRPRQSMCMCCRLLPACSRLGGQGRAVGGSTVCARAGPASQQPWPVEGVAEPRRVHRTAAVWTAYLTPTSRAECCTNTLHTAPVPGLQTRRLACRPRATCWPSALGSSSRWGPYADGCHANPATWPAPAMHALLHAAAHPGCTDRCQAAPRRALQQARSPLCGPAP